MLAKLGIPVTCSDLVGVHGQAWPEELKLSQPYAGKVTSLRQLAEELTVEITLLDAVLAGREGYAAIRHRPGAGHGHRRRDRRHHPVPQTRAAELLGQADLAPPRIRRQGARGHISKQGPRILRWALCEAIWHQPAGTRPQQVKDGIIARRGPPGP